MMNMQNMMKQAQKLQKQMEQSQAELAASQFVGKSAQDLVVATLTGDKKVEMCIRDRYWLGLWCGGVSLSLPFRNGLDESLGLRRGFSVCAVSYTHLYRMRYGLVD